MELEGNSDEDVHITEQVELEGNSDEEVHIPERVKQHDEVHTPRGSDSKESDVP